MATENLTLTKASDDAPWSSDQATSAAGTVTYNFKTAGTFLDRNIGLSVTTPTGTLTALDGIVDGTNVTLSNTDTSGIYVKGSGEVKVSEAGWIDSGTSGASTKKTKYITDLVVPSAKLLNSVTLEGGSETQNGGKISLITVNCGYAAPAQSTMIPAAKKSGIIEQIVLEAGRSRLVTLPNGTKKNIIVDGGIISSIKLNSYSKVFIDGVSDVVGNYVYLNNKVSTEETTIAYMYFGNVSANINRANANKITNFLIRGNSYKSSDINNTTYWDTITNLYIGNNTTNKYAYIGTITNYGKINTLTIKETGTIGTFAGTGATDSGTNTITTYTNTGTIGTMTGSRTITNLGSTSLSGGLIISYNGKSASKTSTVSIVDNAYGIIDVYGGKTKDKGVSIEGHVVTVDGDDTNAGTAVTDSNGDLITGTLSSTDGNVTGSNVTLGTTDNGISVTGSGTGSITKAGWLTTDATTTASSTTKYITAMTIPKGTIFSSVNMGAGTADSPGNFASLYVNQNLYSRIIIRGTSDQANNPIRSNIWIDKDIYNIYAGLNNATNISQLNLSNSTSYDTKLTTLNVGLDGTTTRTTQARIENIVMYGKNPNTLYPDYINRITVGYSSSATNAVIHNIYNHGSIEEIFNSGNIQVSSSNSSEGKLIVSAYDNSATPIYTGATIVENGKWVETTVTPSASQQGPYYGRVTVSSVSSGTAKAILGTGSLSTGSSSNGTGWTTVTDKVVPAEGYLYINEGWFPNTQISLATLIPDDANYTNAGTAQIRKNYEAYNTNGQKLIGTIEDYTPSTDYYTTTNTGYGIINQKTYVNTSANYYIKAGGCTVAGGGLSKGAASGGGLTKGTASGGGLSGGGLTAGDGSVSSANLLTLSDSDTYSCGITVTGSGTVSRAAVTRAAFSQTITRAAFSQTVTRAAVTDAHTAGWIPSKTATNVISETSETVSLDSGTSTVTLAADSTTIGATSKTSNTKTKYVTAMTIPASKTFGSSTTTGITLTAGTTAAPTNLYMTMGNNSVLYLTDSVTNKMWAIKTDSDNNALSIEQV